MAKENKYAIKHQHQINDNSDKVGNRVMGCIVPYVCNSYSLREN